MATEFPYCPICECCTTEKCKECSTIMAGIGAPWDITVTLTNLDRFCSGEDCQRDTIRSDIINLDPCITVDIPGAVTDCDTKLNAEAGHLLKVRVVNSPGATQTCWAVQFWGRFSFKEGFDGSKCHFHCRVVNATCTDGRNDPLVEVAAADVGVEKFLGGLYVAQANTVNGAILVAIKGCPDNCCFAEGQLQITKMRVICIAETGYPCQNSLVSKLAPGKICRSCCFCCCDSGADWDVFLGLIPWGMFILPDAFRGRIHAGGKCAWRTQDWLIQDGGWCTMAPGSIYCPGGPGDCPWSAMSCASIINRTGNYGSACEGTCDYTLTRQSMISCPCDCDYFGGPAQECGRLPFPPCSMYPGWYLFCLYRSGDAPCGWYTPVAGVDDTHCP